MDILLYSFVAHLMSCQEWTDGDEAVQGSEFRKISKGEGGNEFLLRSRLFGKGHFSPLRCLLGEWARKEASGMVI